MKWTKRLSAALALVFLLAAVIVGVVAAAQNFWGIVLVLSAQPLMVVGGWYAVSRRGHARTMGLITVVFGAALVVTGVLIADLNVVRIAFAIILSLLSVASARYALKAPDTPLTVATTKNSIIPARHGVLIMNPKSGGGKVERFHLVDECRKRGIEPVVLQPGDDLAQLAENAIAGGADTIGMAGGDGSQALVAGIAARHDVPFVAVPAGTRNHFALDLGLDRANVVGTLDAFGDCVERRIDLATVNGRIFVNNASLGLYAKIVQSPEYRDAKMQTTTAMLPNLIGPEATPLDLRFTDSDGTSHSSAHMILVSNNPYQLDRLGAAGTRARLDTGCLGIAALRISNATELNTFLTLEATGHARKFKGWREWSAPRFQIDSAGPVDIGIDGEALRIEPPLVFETLPHSLRVRLPSHAVNKSHTLRTVDLVSHSTIVELSRMVSGRAPLPASR